MPVSSPWQPPTPSIVTIAMEINKVKQSPSMRLQGSVGDKGRRGSSQRRGVAPMRRGGRAKMRRMESQGGTTVFWCFLFIILQSRIFPIATCICMCVCVCMRVCVLIAWHLDKLHAHFCCHDNLALTQKTPPETTGSSLVTFFYHYYYVIEATLI